MTRILNLPIALVFFFSRNHNNGKRYRHHVSPDCNTVASLESSSSESRNGLNRYYRQAWEDLHEAAGGRRSRRHDREAPKDGSELVVSDVYPTPNKRRHHHHHHKSDWQPRHHHKDKTRYWGAAWLRVSVNERGFMILRCFVGQIYLGGEWLIENWLLLPPCSF